MVSNSIDPLEKNRGGEHSFGASPMKSFRNMEDNRGEETLENINYWFLAQIPEKISYLAKTAVTAPEGMTLDEWKDILENMAYLFRESDLDTCHQYEPERKVLERGEGLPDSKIQEIQTYLDDCKTEALSLFNHYFWYLDD